jgi:hypothetical protein
MRFSRGLETLLGTTSEEEHVKKGVYKLNKS